MAAKKYFSNLDLNLNQIKNAVLETTTSAAVANPANGQIIFDTGSNVLKYWDSSNWQSPVTRFEGQIVYKGAVAHDAAAPGSLVNGDLYMFNSAGTATNYGNFVVEAGDFAIYDSNAEAWKIIQGNSIQATITDKGIVELATTSEAETGSDTQRVIVPDTLDAWAEQTDKTVVRKRVFSSQTINSSGLTLTHNIGKDNPYVSVYTIGGARVSCEITKGEGTVTLTSNVEISGAKVVISA